ncbi:MAG: hypothetical protein HKL96_11800 [Phycisphaerales bacterium]|nr:hypothetical protein [Phycisphaerales bacterium]
MQSNVHRTKGILAASPHSQGTGAVQPGANTAEWFDRMTPWIASGLVHIGLLLLLCFAYKVVREQLQTPVRPIIVPMGMMTQYVRDPLTGFLTGGGKSVRSELGRVYGSIRWSKAALPTPLISDHQHSKVAPWLIAAGGAARELRGTAGVPFASGLGVGPSLMGAGPGRGDKTNAARIVYIIDHAGGMLENFQFLKRELMRSVDRLSPVQRLAVIVFRKNYEILGPARLVHATLGAKRRIIKLLSHVAPAGPNSYRLRYFERPFRAAFELHPQVIFFVTNGAFDPRLIDVVDKLNARHRVHIFTYAYIAHDPVFVAQLKLLAHHNGGKYTYVSRTTAGQ